MRTVFFSDVHSNLEALTAVMKEIENQAPDRILFLGDAVGYGPDPNECLERIFEISDKWVAGNHDHGAVDLTDISHYNHFARQALLWTRSMLTPENLEKILSMPFTEQEDDFFLVHASPDHPGDWSYIFTAPEAAHHFECFQGKVCLIGHSHRPEIYIHDGNEVEKSKERMLTFQENFRYIVNVGSVGQPRDMNPDAVYVLYDSEERTLSYKRVPYDYRITQEKMRAAHLPSFLIDRLASGV
jgi:diadenosine tetraphosphatase ApaH/serine/threonine PP2A family protein phosphatase